MAVFFSILLITKILNDKMKAKIRRKKMKNKKRKLSVFVEYLKSRQFFGVCMRDYVLRRNEGEV